MKEIHITGIDYVEYSNSENDNFKYKPEVPKLKVVGMVLVDDEKIIWCVGLKISREAMPNAQSDAIVGVWLEKH